MLKKYCKKSQCQRPKNVAINGLARNLRNSMAQTDPARCPENGNQGDKCGFLCKPGYSLAKYPGSRDTVEPFCTATPGTVDATYSGPWTISCMKKGFKCTELGQGESGGLWKTQYGGYRERALVKNSKKPLDYHEEWDNTWDMSIKAVKCAE